MCEFVQSSTAALDILVGVACVQCAFRSRILDRTRVGLNEARA
jgi:hypothetical protein